MQKIQLTRLKLPTPAKEETWVTDQDGDPVFMVVAEPSGSLAGAGGRPCASTGRLVPPCSPISSLPGPACSPGQGLGPEVPATGFTTITCADDGGHIKIRPGLPFVVI